MAGLSDQSVTLELEPIKGISDKRKYRSIKLENGLRVLLVCDLNHGDPTPLADGEDEDSDSAGEEEEEEDGQDEDGEEDNSEEDESEEGETEYLAAAALAVSWGSSEDPLEVPGLMHFLEHMVFMGSEKYPVENSFDQFITRHGGQDNAYTDMEHTNFHFNVQEAYIIKALDRFSQFFIAPLMKKNAMDRERNSVDSEFTMALPSNSNREQQLVQTLAPKDHPASRFTWGNKDTLSALPDDDIHKMLHHYREKYYKSQFMTLVLQSRHPIQDMEKEVVKIFSQIPKSDLSTPDYSGFAFPFPPSTANKVIKMENMKAKHTVSCNWFLPPSIKDYRRQPLRLISNLIGHEGYGSLMSYYKKKNWAVELETQSETGDSEHGSFYSTLRVVIELSEAGMIHVDEVLFALFQYTALLKAQPPTQQMFEEYQKLARLRVDYESENETMDNVESLAAAMLVYNPQDYITGDRLLFEFDPEFSKETIARLTPSTVNIIMRSPLLGDFTAPGTLTEKWFGTKYTVEDISPEWKKLFSKAETEVNSDLHLPSPNLFIPTDFSLLSKPLIPQPKNQVPWEVISEPKKGRLFYKPDYKTELPKIHVRMQFILQKLPGREKAKFLDIVACVLQCYQLHLQEPTYDALLAKSAFQIKHTLDGLQLNVSGFSQTVIRLIDLLMDYLGKIGENFKKDQFEVIKDMEIRSIYNKCGIPNYMKSHLRLHVLLPEHALPLEHLQLMETVTAEEVISCAQNLLRNSMLNMLVQGNLTEEEAKCLYSTVQSHIPRDAVTQDNNIQYFEMPGCRILTEGITVMRIATTNNSNGNSAVCNYYQGKPGSLRDQLLLDFLSSAMEEQCYDQLRTREQLSYSVHCQSNESNGIIGFSLHVTPQAEKFSTNHVDIRIEAFLERFGDHLKNMSAKSFATLKETVERMKKTDDMSLEEEISRHWEEVIKKDFLFDRLEKQLKILDSITKKDLVSFYKSLVDPTIEGYCKLSVQVMGCAEHKKHKPPPVREMIDGGISYLQFDCQGLQEVPVPSCCPSPNFFIKNCQEYINTLKESTVHHIV